MAKRTIGQPMGHLFFGGVSSSDLAPYTFPVSLGPFPYQIDYTYAEQFGFEPYDMLREQADQRDIPGEHSINPAGLWRRSGISHHLGAGQEYYDHEDSSPFRFRASTGMDIWTKFQMGLLRDTDLKLASVNTNLFHTIAGSHFYTLDGSNLKFCTDIDVDTPTFSTLTGTPPATAGSSITSDGFNIFTTHGANGLWKTTRGTAGWAGAAHITGTVSLVRYARGRVIVAHNNSVYDVTALAQGGGGALPTALFVHPNTDFRWTSIGEGRNCIYMAGYSGDKSLIYKAVIKSDGTGLDAPVVAGELPDGEQVEAVYGYLGPFLMVGLGGLPGWRFALVNDNGDLQFGARVKTPLAVKAFEGQEGFIWWAYSNYEADKTGLGRLNIQEFGDPELLIPAYASDLMVQDETAEVQSIVTFQNIRVFGVSGQGIYAEHHNRNLVPEGHLDTGLIQYSMTEEKIGLYFDVTHQAVTGEPMHSVAVSLDNQTFVSLGEHHEHNESFQLGEARARAFEFRIGLIRDPDLDTNGQILTSWLFRAQPVAKATRSFTVPLLVADVINDDDGNEHPFDAYAALDNIDNLHQAKTITQFRIGLRAYPVVIEKYQWRFHKLTDQLQGGGFNGTCLVELKLMSETA